MKFLILFCLAISISVVLGNNPNPETLFPVIGDLLKCERDIRYDRVLPVQLNTSTGIGEVYTPLTSGRGYPPSLVNISKNVTDELLRQLNISEELQTQSLPDFNDILSFPFRYELNQFPDYAALQRICGNDVLANFTQANSSQRNADQGTFWDITNTLESNWLKIWNSTNQTRYPDVSSVSWSGDIIGLFREMMEVLSCRVAFKWADLGVTYVPRYLRGGFCLNRKCSLPDHDDFRCHVDFSPSESRFLEAARWDCCHILNSDTNQFEWKCGFRKVRFPIVCDCDCRCRSQAGT